MAIELSKAELAEIETLATYQMAGRTVMDIGDFVVGVDVAPIETLASAKVRAFADFKESRRAKIQ